MRQIPRRTLPALLAVLALSAATATAAQASTEGPFYKIAGSRLASGSSHEIASTSKSGEIEFTTANDIIIRCSKSKVLSGSKIVGSTGANAGTATATLEFSECNMSGNGKPCEIGNNGSFKTQLLDGTLVYTGAGRTEDTGILLQPATGLKGTFAEFPIEGSGCSWGSTGWKITGPIAADINVGDKVGSEPAQAAVNTLTFPGERVSTIWTETAGVLHEEELPALKFVGMSVAIAGNLGFELTSAPLWGVYTHL